MPGFNSHKAVLLMYRPYSIDYSNAIQRTMHGTYTYRVAQKSKPLPNDQKMVLKPVNEIRFIRQTKV